MASNRFGFDSGALNCFKIKVFFAVCVIFLNFFEDFFHSLDMIEEAPENCHSNVSQFLVYNPHSHTVSIALFESLSVRSIAGMQSTVCFDITVQRYFV